MSQLAVRAITQTRDLRRRAVFDEPSRKAGEVDAKAIPLPYRGRDL